MAKGKTIIEELIGEKSVKYTTVKAKIPDDVQEKITFICNHFDIKEEEYLGKLIVSSEINKVYDGLKKPEKQS